MYLLVEDCCLQQLLAMLLRNSSSSCWAFYSWSYTPINKGWIEVKWWEMENATMTTSSSVEGQVVHAINNTVSHFARRDVNQI